MKTKLFSMVLIISVLSACGGGGYNPPITPGTNPGTQTNPNNGGSGNNNGGNTTPKNPVASFTHETSHPFYAHFKNISQNATSYEWDFGDGSTSTEVSPTHKYKGKGVYKVTLKAKYEAISKQNTYTKNVTIIEPTTCYITNIEYLLVPKNNEYYNIRFTDDYLFFETCYWYSDWVMLSSANMPYKYTLSPKKKIDFGNTEHVMRLYQNSSTSGKGSQVAAWEITTKTIKSKFPESQTGTADNAQVKILLEWAD